MSKNYKEGNRIKYGLIMLNWLKIKNMALIEALDVEFGEGFNVITGETGAGKSILLGTIALLLGGRADKGVIRNGTERCELAAGITVKNNIQDTLLSALEQADIPFEPESCEIQLRRVIAKSSNRNYINDTPVTLQTLKNIGNFLVDIHAANEHQSLLNRGAQLDILDRFGKLNELTGKCRDLCKELNTLRAEREKTFTDMPSSIEAEHLKMIVGEIEKVSPEPDEDERLNVKHSLAANSKTILELSSRAAMQLCDSEESIVDKLGEVYRDIQELAHIDSTKAEPLLTACDQIVEQVRDLSYAIENYGSNVELDEQGFRDLENRLSDLQTLKRRYGPSLERVLLECEKARERLLVYSDAEKLRQEFQKKEDVLLAKLETVAQKLSKARKKEAKDFCRQVEDKLKVLGFLQAELDISFSKTEPTERGIDRIEFLFSANPGEKIQPLRNIASSGEISRVMLALKTVLADADTIPVLIFDEIDVNIGGETANQVGKELRNLASNRQILCISHLAQVAACGQQHYAVVKNVNSGRTTSTIKRLEADNRTTEIARMLGASKAAHAHARELLNL
jgi:DNA repair protein RecN (Recombination protein N)